MWPFLSVFITQVMIVVVLFTFIRLLDWYRKK